LIAIDTNILIYAHREDSPFHVAAASCLETIAESGRDWAIPWPCIHEFLAIATHPRVFAPPSTVEEALAQVAAWLESPRLLLLSETGAHWTTLSGMLAAGQVRGPLVHDARIAALCRQHDIEEFWSADRDFSRFPDLRTRNPLVATS